MVGFLRKKKSAKGGLLADETALDRKGKVDGSSLLDGDGEPTMGSLYNVTARKGSSAQRNSDEDRAANMGYPPVMATGMFPPQHSGYPQSSYGFGSPNQQPPMYGNNNQYGNNSQYGNSNNQFGNNSNQFGNNHQFGAPTGFGNNQYEHQQQPQYGQPQHYGGQYPQQSGGQQQYPIAYGNLPPPMSTAPKKSRFRLPGYGKKN